MTQSHFEDVYELSPMQQGILFHTLYDPAGDLYLEQSVMTLRGRLDGPRFRQAWQRAVASHTILRTSFHWEGLEKPVQVVHFEAEVPVESQDWRGVAQNLQESRLDAFLQEDRKRSFDLASPPMLRVTLFQTADDVHQCVLTFQHLVLDRWSRFLLLKEVFALYAAQSDGRDGRPQPRPYGDYIAWLQAQDRAQAEDFWRRELAGFTTPTALVGGGRHEGPSDRRFEEATLCLSPGASAHLMSFARRHRLTMNTLVQGAWAILAGRYSGEEDVLFGATVSGRPTSLADVDSMVGLFINTLPVRIRVSDQDPVLPWLQKVQARLLDVRHYEHSSLLDIQGWSEVPRGTPLFESLVVFENVAEDFRSLGGSAGLELLMIRPNEGGTNYPLTVFANPGPELSLQIVADGALFDHGAVSRMLGHLATLLEGMISNVDRPVSAIPLLTEPERRQLLHEWNDTARDFPPLCIHDLFEEQVERRPEAVAVVSQGERVTYRELNRRANRLARRLRREGVGPETLVGLCLERSIEMIVGLLGILKAGGAYLPLDPNYPSERLAFMLEDSDALLVLAEARLVERLPPGGGRVLDLERLERELETESDEDLAPSARPENLVYVIYTSGSTGQPKGVEILHRALVNYVTAVSRLYRLTPSDRVLQFSSLSFDSAADEIFIPLSAGATVVLRSDAMLQSVPTFLEACRQWDITILVFATSYWHELMVGMATSGLRFPESVRLTSFGGERALPERLLQWREVAGDRVRLLNGYGPTEATITTTFCDVTEWLATTPSPVSVPIGKPILNVKAYVLDHRGELRPVGMSGELYIGGAGLARGYLNRPEFTREKFVRNPFAEDPAERLYRTGDLVRHLPGGNLEFLRRVDEQVKIRGYRVEPGEVEAILREFAGIRDAVVLAPEEEPGDKRLVAYVVAEKNQVVIAKELRADLKQKLPGYMVPSAFVILDQLPLTPTGKIDRSALARLDQPSSFQEGHFTPPRNPIEEMLADIWSDVLGVERIGTDDDFFALGGHSLLATRVISRIREAFRIELPLRELFEAPTVSELARRVSSATQQDLGPPSPALIPAARKGDLTLSFAQQRLWFLNQLEPGNPFYTTWQALKLSGNLDLRALQAAFAALVERHEALRTRFESVVGRPVQIVEEDLPFQLQLLDLSALPADEREPAAIRRAAREAARPFDLSVAPLLRAIAIRLAEREHVLVLAMHHIVSDGWSMGILVQELAAFYEEHCGGKLARLPKLQVQYGDFAIWQREWLRGEVLERQLSYWRGQLANLSVLELPTDRPRPAIQSFRGARQSLSFSKDLTEGLKKLSQSEGATLYMTLLAAFQALLLRYTGQEDIVVGSPIAGRNRSEIEGLIGFFINILVLRTDLSDDASFRDLLARVREVTLGAFAHQDLPFEKLVEELQPQRDLGRNPLFQVLFTIQNAPAPSFELVGLSASPLPSELLTARFDLEVYVWEKTEGLTCTFVYSADLFDPKTIVRMMAHYQRLLEAVVADPDRHIRSVPLLTETERQQVIFEWNQTERPYPTAETVKGLFEEQVERTPDAVALVFGGERLTYGQLNERANRLAWYLRKRGVGPEVLVGLCVERSVEMVVGILGILKAGGAYVPLDPHYPRQRVAFMLEDSGVSVLLTQESLADAHPEGPFEQVKLDTDWPLIERESGGHLEGGASPENLAYVIYTSGSTGRPKGVAIEHRNTVALLSWAREFFCHGELEGVLASTSVCFDLSVFELFAPLVCGGKVILSRDVLELAELDAASEVTLVNTVPSAMAELLRMGGLPESVGTVNLAGEPLATALVDQIVGAAQARRVFDLYGPTEDTTYSTCALREAGGVATIGRPISNKRAYILEDRLEPVPVGVEGDLYVAGAGVARGYLNRPALTLERFLPDPFHPGERMYRTGDRARFLPDGNIQFLGRRDQQIKIRGYRIEIGEIEQVLSAHPDVRDCAVAARREESPGDRLVAYVVCGNAGRPPLNHLRGFLKRSLPDYMIPSDFLFLDALPLTPNGKLDRKALPAPDATRPELESAWVAPRTATEKTIAEIWGEVLGLDRVGIHDNFFALGGHSLVATRVFARLQAALPTRLSLRALFEKPTVAELAEEMERVRGHEAPLRPAISPVSRRAQQAEAVIPTERLPAR